MRFRSLRDEGGGLVFLHLGQHAFNDILLAWIRAKVTHDGADLLLDHTPLLLLRRREQSVSVRDVQQTKQPERTLSKRSNAALILFFFSVISLAISSAIVVRPDVAVAVALIV